MKSDRRPPPFFLVASTSILVITVWWLLRSITIPTTTPGVTLPTGSSNAPSPRATTTGRPSASLRSQLEGLHALLGNPTTPGQAQEALEALRQQLKSMPPDIASATLSAFLATGADASTALGFAVGPGGTLREAPSLRVFLLDQLGAIDPAEAARLAAVILAQPTSPEEWALAMRNLARGPAEAASRPLLQERFATLLHHEPWLNQPTAGFLEAFDVAVHLGTPELVRDLVALVHTNGHPASAHAAFLALDRMIQNRPAEILAEVLRHPEGLAGHEATRANYLARANVEDPAQRQLVEAYLLNPALNSAELEAFADIFPNANFMMSHNLITTNPEPNPAALTRRDQQSLRVVESWLADPRFTSLQPHLNNIRQRLQGFVNQAKRTP